MTTVFSIQQNNKLSNNLLQIAWDLPLSIVTPTDNVVKMTMKMTVKMTMKMTEKMTMKMTVKMTLKMTVKMTLMMLIKDFVITTLQHSYGSNLKGEN